MIPNSFITEAVNRFVAEAKRSNQENYPSNFLTYRQNPKQLLPPKVFHVLRRALTKELKNLAAKQQSIVLEYPENSDKVYSRAITDPIRKSFEHVKATTGYDLSEHSSFRLFTKLRITENKLEREFGAVPGVHGFETIGTPNPRYHTSNEPFNRSLHFNYHNSANHPFNQRQDISSSSSQPAQSPSVGVGESIAVLTAVGLFAYGAFRLASRAFTDCKRKPQDKQQHAEVREMKRR